MSGPKSSIAGAALLAMGVIVAITVVVVLVTSDNRTTAQRANEACAHHNAVSRIESGTIICRDGYAVNVP